MRHNQDQEKTTPAIAFHDVWKSFNDIAVLKGLSLSVPKNATTVILGRSGAGKSVTLKLILGTEDADQGQIIIDGTDVSHLTPKARAVFSSHRVGMLFQSSALFDSMTVEENIAFALEHVGQGKNNHHFSDQEIKNIISNALEKVDLAGFQEKFPSELSGGQKRRAALARLIVYRPHILLFDEPTTGLDPVTAKQINYLIIETQKQLQSTSIVVTHDLISALTIGHYFALHHEGKIIVFGNKQEFFTNPDPILASFIESSLASQQDQELLQRLIKIGGI